MSAPIATDFQLAHDLSADALRTLAETEGGTCVSIYFPTVKAGKDTLQNSTRLKNHLAKAKKELEAMGMAHENRERFLEPLADLAEDYPFSQHQEEGFALLATDGWSQGIKLPYAVPETTVVANRFHLKPLLPLIYGDRRFHILSIGKKGVRLYEASRYHIEAVDVEDLPTDIDDALWMDDPEKSLQMHRNMPEGAGPQSGGAESKPMYHGQGVAKDHEKNRVLRFFRQVNDAVAKHLKDSGTPLILACLDQYLPIYREANTYNNLVSDMEVSGNPADKKPEQLRDEAVDHLRGKLNKERDQMVKTFGERVSQDLGSTDLRQVAKAAYMGRVEACFVDKDKMVEGSVDEDSGEVRLIDEGTHHCAGDLLDYIAVKTFATGGCAYVVDGEKIPGGGPAAAVFRFSLRE